MNVQPVKIIFMGLVLAMLYTCASYACESGHWIEKKTSDGSIIILEDGSTWEIDPIDRIDTALWLVTENIIVCEDDGVLINTDSNAEKVGAKQIN